MRPVTCAAAAALLLAAASACNETRELYVTPPHFVAVGSSVVVYATTLEEAFPNDPPFRITAASCSDGACRATPNDRDKNVNLTALRAGASVLSIDATWRDVDYHADVPVTFWEPKHVEMYGRRPNYREDIAILPRTKIEIHATAFAEGIRDPLIVSEGQFRWSIEGGDAVSGASAREGQFDIVAQHPGVATLVVETGSVRKTMSVRVASEDDVVSVELRQLNADPHGLPEELPTSKPLNVFPLDDAMILPILHLRDGSIGIAGEDRITFDPPELVTMLPKAGYVQIKAKAAGSGVLGFKVGTASTSLKWEVEPRKW